MGAAGANVIESPFFHPNHVLLRQDTNTTFICGACNTVGFGLRYSCTSCTNFHVHPRCATGGFSEWCEVHKDHQLTRFFHFPSIDTTTSSSSQKKIDTTTSCQVCKQKITGIMRYQCNECSFYVHPVCSLDKRSLDGSASMLQYIGTASKVVTATSLAGRFATTAYQAYDEHHAATSVNQFSDGAVTAQGSNTDVDPSTDVVQGWGELFSIALEFISNLF